MRRTLPLTLGLALLAVSIGAGTAVGQQGSVVGVGEDGVEVNIPDGGNLQDVEVIPQCSNLIDDDGDTLTDTADLDCTGPLDPTESGSGAPPAPAPTDPTQPPGGGGNDTGGQGGGGQGGGNGDAVSGPGGTGGRGGGPEVSPEDTDYQASDKEVSEHRKPMDEQADRTPDGIPTDSNPGLTIADFGPAPIGVPNFVIDSFSIPPFLLPIYQACGTQYGIPWQILASINRIETAFGTNLNVSSAGAVGWMQFLPSTWRAYGVDANADGRRDPYNPVDAICAAARYLDAAGWENDERGAIFAYNHADWYVDEVIFYARQYGSLPEDLIGSLTGLTEGARFPVAADARYADDISERQAARRSKPTKHAAGNAADVFESSPTRRGVNIYARAGAPVVAANDGVITKIGRTKRLGRYLVLRDVYGNRFTYAELDKISDVYPVAKRNKLSAADFRLVTPADERPTAPASAGKVPDGDGGAVAEATVEETTELANTEDARERLYAFPERARNVDRADLSGQLDKLFRKRFPGYESFKAFFSGVLRFDRRTMEMRPLEEGSKVIAGTVLGRIGKTSRLAPHLHFAIRPTGRGAPRIDPVAILNGWKLLEATAIYRAAGENPFTSGATTGQVLLMSKSQLVRRALADPGLEIYSCGREDIRTGQIDRRVLAMLAYLRARGFRLTVTSLKCGHSIYTTSGSRSHHADGAAVDIAQINDIPVLGNQGPGSITEALVRELMLLQGSMEPTQIITLMDLGDNTFAMSDHADHVHVGYTPLYGPGSGSVSEQFNQILEPDQWQRLIGRIGEIDNPDVPTSPSRYALPSRKGHAEKATGGDRASSSHLGE